MDVIQLSIMPTTSLLAIQLSRCATVGDRSFATAGPRIWNSLPEDATSATSLLTFRQKLEAHLFRQSYPDIIYFVIVSVIFVPSVISHCWLGIRKSIRPVKIVV